MPARRLPLWNDDAEARTIETERQIAQKILSEGRTAENVIALATQAADMARSMTAMTLAALPPPSPIACKDGCAWCCYIKVTVRAPEVIRIADYLRRSLDAEALANVHGRVIAADARTRGMTTQERARIKLSCPLLEDDRCSVYPVRPLACAGCNSLEAEKCKDGYENATLGADVYSSEYEPQSGLVSAIGAGMSIGVAQSGMDGSALELIAALRIALDRANAADRWVQGRQVFSQAHDAELASELKPGLMEALKGRMRTER